MGMLLIGLALFFAVHLVTTATALRRGMMNRLGEGPYKGVYSLLAAIGLVLVVIGYPRAQASGANTALWAPPAWGRHVTMLLMLPVFPLLAAANLPGRISAAVRHPMVTAVMLWGAGHLLVRGDLASMLLFGGFLAWAVIDRITLVPREAAGLVKIRPPGPGRNDLVAIVAGVALYALFLVWAHGALIGVPILR